MTNRREFMSSALSVAAMAAAAGIGDLCGMGRGVTQPSTRNPAILSVRPAIWGRQHDIAWAIKRVRPRTAGIEPYPKHRAVSKESVALKNVR